MGNPLASLVTLTDSFSKILAKYRQVASPSIVALVATSISSSVFTLSIREFMFRSSGPMPSKGDNTPPNTWYNPLKIFVFSNV